MTDTNQDDAQARGLVWRYIQEIGTCMMVTVVGEDVRARPMRGLARPEINTIWFFADRTSMAGQDGAQATQACLTYADVKGQTYVSVTGSIAVIEDRKLLADLSNPAMDAYFPDLPNNPDAMLLKFEPQSAEYWDAPSSPILLAIRFLQAKISGERPDLGTQGSAKLGP